MNQVNAIAREWLHQRTLGLGLRTGCIAHQGALLDTLEDGRQAKETEHQVKVPVIDALATGVTLRRGEDFLPYLKKIKDSLRSTRFPVEPPPKTPSKPSR